MTLQLSRTGRWWSGGLYSPWKSGAESASRASGLQLAGRGGPAPNDRLRAPEADRARAQTDRCQSTPAV
jgi:hypothetical protein